MPYDNFDGIRNIQLAVRKHDLFETPPVIVAVDLSEWLGHEQDEYFISTIRFCCDHSNWKYIFTIRGEFGRRAKDMYQLISSYMKGRLITADPPAPFDDIKPFIKEVI